MERRQKILGSLELTSANGGRPRIGAEIGPLQSPLVKKGDVGEGVVFYVDHADTETLRARWSTDPSIDPSKLHVDAVWGQRTLREAIDASDLAHRHGLPGCGLDYVVASHVIEHVPDLIAWLQEIAAILRSDGSLRLAIPDKRYSFDLLRRTSTFAEVADAFVRKRRVPSGSRVLDFTLNMATVDCAQAWAGTVDHASLVHGYTVEGALSLAADAEINGNYHDVHCWVFTPESFIALCLELSEAGLLGFECQRLIPTSRNELEFFVWMRPCSDKRRVSLSWEGAGADLIASTRPPPGSS